MDYEKKYKESLALMVDCIPDEDGYVHVRPQDIFPELKGSGDEKIRKTLIDFFQDWRKNRSHCWGISVPEILTWLEKQGTPNQVSIWKHWKDGICGNGEGKLIYLIKNGDAYSLSSGLGYECDYILLSDLDNLMLEKQGEQKPSDEDMKEALRTEYEKGRADAFAEMQKEWSEEDERIRQCLIQDQEEALDDVCNDKYGHSEIISDLKEMYHERIDWLKFIKDRVQPQNTWKPSDAQMVALKKAISQLDLGLSRVLNTLYNDLDKLTKE